MPLPASTTTFSGREPRQVHQAAQVLGVALEDVLDADQAACCRPTGMVPALRYSSATGLDFLESGFGGDGHGAGLGHLDAVVFGRVVARGERGTGSVEGAARVVELVGGDQVQQLDVGPAGGCAVGEGLGELGGGGAHVAADQDSLALEFQDIDEGGTDGFDDFGGDGFAHDSADVIGLEGGREVKSLCLFASHASYLTLRL